MANDPDNAPIGEDPKIDSLEDRIAAARKAEDDAPGEGARRRHAPGRSAAMQVVSTMVGYPLGGIIIGLVLDNVLGTLPWLTIGLMFLAFAGACMHVVRMNKNRAE